MDIHKFEDWRYRIYQPVEKVEYPTIFLFHGLGGDLKSMDIFARRLMPDAAVVSLQGLFPAPKGGYQWLNDSQHQDIWVDDFLPAVEAFMEFLRNANIYNESIKGVRLAGFSQGAAFVYSFALLKPNLVHCFAGLAGFTPNGSEAIARNKPLLGKPGLIAHGKLDRIIPIRYARESRRILEEAGATITYCEDEVGHKIGADCFPGFASFMLNC